MDDCPDQQKDLVLKGFKAYVEQMQRHGSMGRFQPPIRMPLRSIRHPEIDVNANRTGRRDEKSSSDNFNGIVKDFGKVRIDSPETEDQKEAIVNRCICLRTICLVFCKFCGYHTKGRIAKNCSVHPNVMFLMDISQCPRCKTYGLIEHPLPN